MNFSHIFFRCDLQDNLRLKKLSSQTHSAEADFQGVVMAGGTVPERYPNALAENYCVLRGSATNPLR
jgi:hypothetical protein